MNTINNSVVNKESAMSIAFVIFAILAIITAIWKGSTMNKFVSNKESVMLVVSKRSIALAYSIVCTAVLFIPYALVATFQETAVCTLALAPLAFTAIDMFIYAEYYDNAREIALAYKALKDLPAYEAKVKAKYAAMFLALFCSACGTDTTEVPEFSIQTKLDINYAIDMYEEVAVELEEYYYQLNNAHEGIGVIRTKGEPGPLEDTWNCTAWQWKGKIYTAQHCVRELTREVDGDVAVRVHTYENNIKSDLYEVGLECSPDLRWWGARNDGWGTIPTEQAFVHYKKAAPNIKLQAQVGWAYLDAQFAADNYEKEKNKSNKEKAKNAFQIYVDTYNLYMEDASEQRFICASGHALELKPTHGDSGGPLMAGDEVIGFVSYGESQIVDGPEEDLFDSKYGNSALYGNYTFCWGSFDRSLDRPNTRYTEDNTRRYNDIVERFVTLFGQQTVNSW